jgi:peptide-methionine (S)-S-oxide reductase
VSKATFAAGCFWGVQAYFDEVPGVTESYVGYIGGHVENPDWDIVCTHTTGHAEAVTLTYDPEKVSYETLARHFFRIHDPTQLNRQGPDIGDNYRSAVFVHDDEQRAIIEQLTQELQAEYDEPIVTTVEPASTFWVAEEFHQKFTEKTGRGACHVSYAPIER